MLPTTAPRGFEWRETRCGLVLRCRALEPLAAHFFTTRSLDLRGADDGNAGWRLVAESAEILPEGLQRIVQVHGANAFVIRKARHTASRSDERPIADLLATDDPSVALAIQVADCVPILLADSRGRAVAAVHAGWRGAAQAIARMAVSVLRSEFGIAASELIAAVGPSIGPRCYQVGEELRAAFVAAGHSVEALARWFSDGGSRSGTRLDLWRANTEQLMDAGLRASSIHVAGLCTVTRADLFHSYRRDGARAGRMAAVIRCRSTSAAG